MQTVCPRCNTAVPPELERCPKCNLAKSAFGEIAQARASQPPQPDIKPLSPPPVVPIAESRPHIPPDSPKAPPATPTPKPKGRQKETLTLVAFDVETTGLRVSQSGIIELGAVKFTLEDDHTETFSELANPGHAIPPEVVSLTGITDNMVMSAQPSHMVVNRFLQWAGNESILIAHNASFDAKFLCAALQNNKTPVPPILVVDTLQWARKSKLVAPDYKLQTLLQYIGKATPGKHRSLDDATGVMHLARFLCGQIKGATIAIKRRAIPLLSMTYDPATAKQIGYLHSLMADPRLLVNIDRLEASLLIDELKAKRDKGRRNAFKFQVGCMAFGILAMIIIGSFISC